MHFSIRKSAALVVLVVALPSWGSPIPSSTSSDVQDGYVEYYPRSVKAADFWKRVPAFYIDDDIARRAPYFEAEDGFLRQTPVLDAEDDLERRANMEARSLFRWLKSIPRLFKGASRVAETVNTVADTAENLAQAGSAVATTVGDIKSVAKGQQPQQPQQPQQKRDPTPDPSKFGNFWKKFKNGVTDVLGFAGSVTAQVAPIASQVIPLVTAASGDAE